MIARSVPAKLKTFLSLDPRVKVRYIEAFAWLGCARLLLVALPFRTVAPLLGAPMRETPAAGPIDRTGELYEVYETIRIAAGHTFWESKCLVKAIAAMKMLERRRIDSTLYLGTARDENGAMVAHAWLRSGSYYITGAEEKERYAVVATFAKFSGG